jgi:hypothetical protein
MTAPVPFSTSMGKLNQTSTRKWPTPLGKKGAGLLRGRLAVPSDQFPEPSCTRSVADLAYGRVQSSINIRAADCYRYAEVVRSYPHMPFAAPRCVRVPFQT